MLAIVRARLVASRAPDPIATRRCCGSAPGDDGERCADLGQLGWAEAGYALRLRARHSGARRWSGAYSNAGYCASSATALRMIRLPF
jgi:hypothetical protein